MNNDTFRVTKNVQSSLYAAQREVLFIQFFLMSQLAEFVI